MTDEQGSGALLPYANFFTLTSQQRERDTNMFITFEGLDYSGKSTQVRLLESRLKQSGKIVLVLREPGGTAIGEKIRDLLLDKKNSHLTDVCELFLFSASRAQLVTQVILPELQRGTIVICDRYDDSTTAYQGWGRSVGLESITTINACATGGLRPDITFFIDIPVEEVEKRMQKVKGTPDRMESNGLHFYDRVRAGYMSLVQTEKRFHLIDGMKPIEEIHKIIWDAVTGGTRVEEGVRQQ